MSDMVAVVSGCNRCGQPLRPGIISCRTKALEVKPNGKLVLVLVARCPSCEGPVVVELSLHRYEEDK